MDGSSIGYNVTWQWLTMLELYNGAVCLNPLQAKFLPQKWSFQALNKLVLSPVDYSQCIGQKLVG